MEKTIKELQKELIDLGFSEKALAGIKTKEALLAIIDSIKAKPVTTLNPPVDPKEQRTDEQSWQGKRNYGQRNQKIYSCFRGSLEQDIQRIQSNLPQRYLYTRSRANRQKYCR